MCSYTLLCISCHSWCKAPQRSPLGAYRSPALHVKELRGVRGVRRAVLSVLNLSTLFVYSSNIPLYSSHCTNTCNTRFLIVVLFTEGSPYFMPFFIVICPKLPPLWRVAGSKCPHMCYRGETGGTYATSIPV